jgi:hypothetical protein
VIVARAALLALLAYWTVGLGSGARAAGLLDLAFHGESQVDGLPPPACK